jgi:hypothetical protein
MGLTNLQQISCGEGRATSNSQPDGYGFDGKFTRFIGEVKGGESSAINGLRQAIPEGCNVAYSHLKAGKKIDEIVVPIFGSTGSLMVFGAVLMLEPYCPYAIILSKTLDLIDDNDRFTAANLLFNIDLMMSLPLLVNAVILENEIVSMPNKCFINKDKYYIKNLTAYLKEDMNLLHYFSAMKKLSANEILINKIVFPYCIIDNSIIFQNMLDYNIGLPTDEFYQELYCTELEYIISEVHSMGFLHLDLYPSNILYKISDNNSTNNNDNNNNNNNNNNNKQENVNLVHNLEQPPMKKRKQNISIMIIDWDTIWHKQYRIPEFMMLALDKNTGRKQIHAKMFQEKIKRGNLSHKELLIIENECYDLSMLKLIRENKNNRLLQANKNDKDSKGKLDEAFWNICNNLNENLIK